MKLNREQLSKLPPEEIIELVLLLQEQNEAKNSFFRGLNHELRVPVHAILGFNELIGVELEGQLTSNVAEYLGYINKSGDHLLSFINETLDSFENQQMFAYTETSSNLITYPK